MKEVQEGARSQAWGCPRHPKTYSKEPQASKLGDAQGILFFANNHQVSLVSLYFYFFAHYVLFLERLFAFTFSFLLLCLLDTLIHFLPNLFWRETLIFFTYIFLSVIASYVLLLALVFLYHHVQSYSFFYKKYSLASLISIWIVY